MHIHFIGICGVAMSAIAIALQEAGHNITGSDAGFYPPVSGNLKKYNINFYPGWHPEKMTAQGDPDLVVVGNVASSNNPEWLYTKVNNLEYKSFPEVLRDFFITKNSIVVAGNYGKTTSSTLLSFILTQANLDPSYMFGGVNLNNLPPARIGKGAWSVVEGDEYKTSRWDKKAKFYHYKPTHLLLTAVVWDHADVYPTDEEYVKAFQDLYDMTSDEGVRLVSEKAAGRINLKDKKVITYGPSDSNNYQFLNIKSGRKGTSFEIKHNNTVFEIETQMLGDYMADNITGCFAMANEIGIDTKVIIKAIKDFTGIKRRLEKRFDSDVLVFDDIAHSPSKAEGVISSLRKVYDGKIIAIFEPNTGNRKSASISQYDFAFKEADEVVIPKLSKLKIDPTDIEKPLDGKNLAEVIGKTHKHVSYIESDSDLINHITRNRASGDVLVFLGSHSFRGMIDEAIKKLRSKNADKR